MKITKEIFNETVEKFVRPGHGPEDLALMLEAFMKENPETTVMANLAKQMPKEASYTLLGWLICSRSLGEEPVKPQAIDPLEELVVLVLDIPGKGVVVSKPAESAN